MPNLQPFQVTVERVEDQDLGPVLTELAKLGYRDPQIRPLGEAVGPAAGAASTEPREFASVQSDELPDRWEPVREEHAASYRWPEYEERYDQYRVYTATTEREGRIHVGLGWAQRKNKWGRDRRYVVAFLSSGTPTHPLVEFLEADDYETTGEFVAIIRGMDGGRRMYGPRDTLPDVYEQNFPTQMYGDRVRYPGVWNKVVVVAPDDAPETMLNHALIQGRRRYGI